jgi:hypothetical protein
MRNHLFIGLGGQGGRTLAELRRVMAQRAKDTAKLQEAGTRWEFLAIDSSTDVRNDLKCWNYFGTDLSLNPSDWLVLNSVSPEDVDALALRADVAPWIGKPDQIKAFLKGNRIEGANQRRRFGRLLFAHNASSIRHALFGQKVAALIDAGHQQCAFHIFASLAGGTGSGCIVDLVTTIRAEFPNPDMANGYPIFLYVYVTHNDGKASDVGYFYQNQFAALRDLNALICNRLTPHLLGVQVAGQVYAGNDPSAQVVLTNSLNRANMGVQLATQIRVVAESCFERIYAWTAGQMAPETQRAITGQDRVANFPGEPLGHPERSYRFAGFGMRRWEVPNAKIEELLALDLLSSSLRQMLFNHWQASEGYIDTLPAMPRAMAEVCSANLEKVGKEYLLVQEHSSTLAVELRQETGQLVEGLLRQTGGDYDLDALEPAIRDYFEQTFRGGGVSSYFQSLTLAQGLQLSEAIDRIDKALTSFWMDPAKPLALAYLPDLIEMLATALRGKLEGAADLSADGERLARRRAARKVEWEKITPLSALVGKRRALFMAHTKDCVTGYTLDLQRRCGEVDSAFIRGLLERLRVLRSGYEAARELLLGLLKDTEAERDGIYRDLRDLQGQTGANKYEFDQEALDEFLRIMRTHQEHQFASAGTLRGTINETLSDGPLTRLRNRGLQSNEHLEENLRQAAMVGAKNIHSALVMKNAAPGILGDSLLKRLEERFQGNDASLRNEVEKFVNLAASCLHCRDGQTQPVTLLGQNVGVSLMPRRVFVLGLPGQGHAYGARLSQAFKEIRKSGDDSFYDVYTHDDPTQLRLFFVDYWMAARFTTVAAELSRAYQRVAEGGKAGDTAYFCNIDPDGEAGKRPSLFLPTPEEMRIRYEAELWLGKRLRASSREDEKSHLIVEDGNGLFLMLDDNKGNRRPELLGANEAMTLQQADDQKMFALHAAIMVALQPLPDREKVVEALIQEENERRRGTETSPEYGRWTLLRDQVYQLIR